MRNSGKHKNMNVAQTAVVMAILTLLSKLFGFLRETVMAALFGANYVIDAYAMAQSIPNMILAGFLTAVSTSFMPLFSEKMEQGGEKVANSFVNEVLNLVLKTAVVVGGIGIFLSPQLVHIFARGYEGERAALTVFFVRIVFIYLIFSSANALLTKYLEYKNVFLPQIYYGYLHNLCIIVFSILAARYSEKLLIFGMFFSYLLTYTLLRRLAAKKGLKRNLRGKTSSAARQIVALALPTFIGGYVSTINTYVDKSIVSQMGEGGVAALSYADTIVGLINGLTFSIISTILFPKLNQARAQHNQEYYNTILCRGFNLYALIMAPIAFGAMFFANEVVQVVYERGAFGVQATTVTAEALFGYSLSILLSALYTQSIYAFQTNKDMKTPMYIGIVSVITNAILSVILSRYIGIRGLTLATSIAAGVSLLLSIAVLRKKYPLLQIVESTKKIWLILMASFVSVLFSWILYARVLKMIWMPRMCYLIIAILIAAILYLGEVIVLRIDELDMLKALIKRKGE